MIRVAESGADDLGELLHGHVLILERLASDFRSARTKPAVPMIENREIGDTKILEADHSSSLRAVSRPVVAWLAHNATVDPEGVWEVRGGEVTAKAGPRDPGGQTAPLDYNNPFGYEIERVWFDGRIIFASEQGELDIDESKVKVAQEYQVVYGVDLDDHGKLRAEPERVEGQLNIYDSVPGMPGYSPIWQFNYVIVPRDYVPNTLRSMEDCVASGYEIRRSRVFEN